MKKFILICLLVISQICSAQMISSYYADQLDLDRVLNLFCMSNTTEEFEKELNAPNSHLSTLDLNNDGYIDYLRCLELAGIHDTIYVLIEACIGEDQYYEVAVICIKKTYNNVTVYISGNELLYGPNYIIRPVYNIYYYPIYNRHWVYGYYWHSPYRWGYWPPHYRPYHPYRPYRPYHPQPYRPTPNRHVTRVANPVMPPSEPYRSGSSTGNRHTTRVATPVNTGRTQPQQSVNRGSSIVRTTTPTSNNTRTSSGDSRNTYTSTRPSSGTTTNARTSVSTSGSRNNSVSTSRSTVQPAKSSSSAVRSSNTGSRSSSGGSNVNRSSNVRSSSPNTMRSTSTRTTSSGSNPSGSRSSQNAVRR